MTMRWLHEWPTFLGRVCWWSEAFVALSLGGLLADTAVGPGKRGRRVQRAHQTTTSPPSGRLLRPARRPSSRVATWEKPLPDRGRRHRRIGRGYRSLPRHGAVLSSPAARELRGAAAAIRPYRDREGVAAAVAAGQPSTKLFQSLGFCWSTE